MVRLKFEPSLTNCCETVSMTGACSTTRTVTWKLFRSLNAPLSVTRTVIVYVPACAGAGVHVNRPVLGSIAVPDGAPGSSVNVSGFAGTSGSVAVAVKANSVLSSIVAFEIAASVGARFASLTVTLKLFTVERGGDPLSVATTETEYVFGPCCSVGVHVNAPVVGLIAAPAGLPTPSEYSIVCPASGSVADAVNCNSVCSVTVLSGIALNTGG